MHHDGVLWSARFSKIFLCFIYYWDSLQYPYRNDGWIEKRARNVPYSCVKWKCRKHGARGGSIDMSKIHSEVRFAWKVPWEWLSVLMESRFPDVSTGKAVICRGIFVQYTFWYFGFCHIFPCSVPTDHQCPADNSFPYDHNFIIAWFECSYDRLWMCMRHEWVQESRLRSVNNVLPFSHSNPSHRGQVFASYQFYCMRDNNDETSRVSWEGIKT